MAVEEKLDALNESLVEAFKRDNPDLWDELSGMRANFSMHLINLRREMERSSQAEFMRAKSALEAELDNKVNLN